MLPADLFRESLTGYSVHCIGRISLVVLVAQLSHRDVPFGQVQAPEKAFLSVSNML